MSKPRGDCACGACDGSLYGADRVEAARRFLGARTTVDDQLSEQLQTLVQLRSDLNDTRASLARQIAENLKLKQQNEALLWSLVRAHQHYVVKAPKEA